jgi:hypothetical protein
MQLRTYEGTEFLYVPTQGSPETIIAAVRNTLSQLDPRLPFSEIVTMQQQVSESLWQERLLAVLAAVFSAVSILMAATGLCGLLAYDAAQRTREFGIRIAVGAQRGSVASLLLQDLLRIVVPGAAAGVLLCLMLSRLVVSTLYGVRPTDPVHSPPRCSWSRPLRWRQASCPSGARFASIPPPSCATSSSYCIAAGSAAQYGCCHVGGGPGLVLELFQKRPFLRKERQRRPDLCRSMQLCMHTRQQQKTR